jgi:predicted RNA-binding protein with PUA-like domain
MKHQHWLVKQEPDSYAWDQFVQDKKTAWEGVRNYAARNHLKAMQVGDLVLFYASMGPKAVIGTAEVSRAAFPDPTADEPGWVAVELKAGQKLKTPVTLAQIKATPALGQIPLIRQGRLSVMPVTAAEYALIVKMGR